jgi:CubicO group peptidase (beta-lactamase class C family)
LITDDQLPRSTPEAQGISSAAILSFVEEAEKKIHDLHSLMLLRHGHLVASGWWSPYAAERPHMLYSLSKSLTSTAVGLAIAEGRLSVQDKVLSFFPEESPVEVSENLAAMRVHHLLSMSTGHTEDTLGYLFQCADGNWVKAFLALPVPCAPGTHFLYNTGATYMLSAILQKLTGGKLLDYLQQRLFAPLGITGATWESCPRGINTGGFGLSIKTEDIARFGQLYLQRGLWQGRRIIPESWVAQATARQISNGSAENNDWQQGYGYQFWRCRHGAYRGDGAFGQYCIVMPDQDAVLAITSGLKEMQTVLNLVWERLLPAMGSSLLPEDRVAERLRQKLASLALLPAQGQRSSPMMNKVSGKRYIFAENDQQVQAISLDWRGDQCICTIQDIRGEHQVVCGSGAWREGMTTLDNDAPRRVAASGAWTADDSYEIKVCFYETPFCPTLTFRFLGDELAFDFRANVAFGPTDRPTLTGRTAKG